MDPHLWRDVDRHLERRFIGADAALQATLEASRAAGLPAIQVSPTQGKFLMLLAQAVGARRILEVGTLGGYSTLWLARALGAGGTIVSCELRAEYAAVARENLRRAGLVERVQLRVGPARDSLAQLMAEQAEPFDLVFIDADKAGYPDYLAAALALSRPGTVIIGDNVIREGRVLHGGDDPNLRGLRRFLERLSSEPRLSATVLQTVGDKGYDGFAFAIVR